MASIMGYSTGRITFISNGGQEREYSERSLTQLIEVDFPNAKLCALDVENGKRKIFDIPLRNKTQYIFGVSNDDPDEVRGDDGIYQLSLNETSRKTFHDALNRYFQQLDLMNPSDNPPSPPRLNHKNTSNSSNRIEDTRLDGDRSRPVEPVKSNPSIVSPKDLLLDVNLLNRYIQQGNINEAAQKASELSSHRVSLVLKPSIDAGNEKEFTIQVQLDGNDYSIDQNGGRIPVNVFQSTTVRELRAAFELAYQYPPTSQYFFVNGGLADDASAMKDLNVGPNSLFILFVLTHPRKTERGPWNCSVCGRKNQTHNLRCVLCSARH